MLPGCRETVIDRRQRLPGSGPGPAGLAEAMEKFCRDPGSRPEHGSAAPDWLAEKKYDVDQVNAAIRLDGAWAWIRPDG